MKNKIDMAYNVRDIHTMRELVDSSCDMFADRVAFLRHKDDDVEEITYRRAGHDILAFATYMNSLGLENTKIAVIGKNCYEWALTYLAVCAGTGIIIPIDRELRSDEVDFLLTDSEASAVVYAPEQAEKINACTHECKKLPMDEINKFIAMGEALQRAGDRSYDEHKVNPDALGILLYTSGTTGVSKGVMLSQRNICTNFVSVMKKVLVTTEDRVLSVLPLHHTYECTAGFLSMFYSGASIAYNESLRKLQSDFAVFKPTIFIAVPLIIEKFHRLICKKYSEITGGNAVLFAQKTMATLFSGIKGSRNKIFSTVNAFFGGRLHSILCGAASMSPNVFHDFEKFGIKMYVGYGLTETSPVCIMHNDGYKNADDIGFPICNVQAKLVDVNDDGVGELAVKGPNVMLGYYKNPEETSRVIRDGWFYTGDLARVTDRGTYKITGRVKSMIVTQSGKKIFPEELEYYILKSPLVKECLVYSTDDEEGDTATPKTTIVASIFPDKENVEAELKRMKISPDSENYDDEIRKLFERIIKDVNGKTQKYKRIDRILIRRNEFVKTTTQKVKRLLPENLCAEKK